MVQHFDDPNLELDEVAWFHILGECMLHTYKNVRSSQKLIKLKKGRNSLLDEDEFMSCYVELHSHPVGSNGQNHILAHPPFKFLPIEEFEKRQKSVKPDDWIPKALMAPPKPSKPASKPKNGKKKNKKRTK